MFKYIIRRLAIFPLALILIHFLGFSYAYIARPIRAARTPYLREQVENPLPLLVSYQQHIQDILSGSLFEPIEKGPQIGTFAQDMWNSFVASLGLLVVALILSTLFGMLLGLLAVRNQPPSLRGWFTPFTSLGLAMPSFYIGSLSILAIVFVSVANNSADEKLLPIRGFGWDAHLVLPVFALMLFPTVQIAQVTANLMVGELGKQYIIAARSFGHTWHDIRWRQAMRNIMAAIILTIAKTFRILVGELVVVEWLFNWPGLGRLLASTLVPGRLSTNLGASRLFLDPTIIAFDIVIIAALFLLADIIASAIVRIIDPRLRNQDEPNQPGGLG